jgi:hypothetical protein cdivTM_02561
MHLQDAELYRLRSARDTAKQRQQTAWQTQQSAYERRSSANAIMNQAYEAQQTAYANQQAAWDAYMSVKQANGPRIDWLNSQQEHAFQNMKQAFENASSAYERRDGASASMYAAELRGIAIKKSLRLTYMNGADWLKKFDRLVISFKNVNQPSRMRKITLVLLKISLSPPKQSMNVRKLNLTRQRLSLMIVPRRSRIGSMN